MSTFAPLLIYDGDCAFCRYWVRYWQALTGDRVRYAPYQTLALRFPHIPVAAFRQSIHFIAPDGSRCTGAQASFSVLANAPGHGLALWLYRRLPAFAALSEGAYRLVARHRGGAYRISRWLWGREHRPAQLTQTARTFVRTLTLIYLAAFASLGLQIVGLVGANGLLPAGAYLTEMARAHGVERYALLPTVFWWNASDLALRGVCIGGVLASLLLLFGQAQRWCLAALYIGYLSLFYAGQVFMNYQWDLLLLEAGFLAFALWRAPALLVWTARWLLLRFMLMSGLVKWFGDDAWLQFTALRHHFETQPIPAPGAWWAATLPEPALWLGTVGTLAIELVVPWLVLAPRRLRFAGAWIFIAFQGAIIATGNYGYFNLLTIVLCLTLFDDAALRSVVPRRWLAPVAAPTEWTRAGTGAIAFAVASWAFGWLQVAETVRAPRVDSHEARLVDAVSSLRIVNRYGPFKALTTERPEIAVEVSSDGRHWREIAFRDKPGDIDRPPRWIIPHQPRLDWQMWFAAPETQREHPWFAPLMTAVLTRNPAVLSLLDPSASTGRPPTAVRAVLYDIRFADAADRRRGHWWVRKPVGLYFPAVELQRDAGGAARLVPIAQLQMAR